MKIAFFDAKDYDKTLFNDHNQSYNYEITYFESKLNSETAPLAAGYDVVCIFVHDIIDSNTIDKLLELNIKLIALRCAGYNNVDLEYLNHRIPVVRVPEYSPYAVAEHAVAILLNLNRKLYKSYTRSKKYNFSLDGLLGFDIYGKTVGVIGTGKIGKVFIRIMKGFGANVIAYDMYPDNSSAEEIGYTYTDLNSVYSQSDIISLHCPLTQDTQHMINADSISKMKNGVYIINTSRGKLINTSDLINMLQTGKIGGVGLDVYEEEDKFFLADMSNSYIRDEELSVLLTMPNVLITAHQAFFTKEALEKITTDTLKNIQDISNNIECSNEIKY